MKLSLGDPIAHGSRSTVHAWGSDAVAKVPMPDTPDAWIRTEADYTSAVHLAGAPVPDFLGFENHEGRTVSIYRRALGVRMWDAVLEHPDQADAHGHLLAELQVLLASLVPPIVLPAQVDRLRSKIRIAAGQTDSSLAAALTAVPTVSRVVLCHGDLHPSNVIITVDGPVIVDWFDASRGDAVGDVARTTVLLATDSGTDHLAGARRELLERLCGAYVGAASASFGFDPATLEQWRAVVAVARIAEGIPLGPLRDVWLRWVRHHG